MIAYYLYLFCVTACPTRWQREHTFYSISCSTTKLCETYTNVNIVENRWYICCDSVIGNLIFKSSATMFLRYLRGIWR
jgi:hypothetical protein